MGKVIVIKGADFSKVAVERIEYSAVGRTKLNITQNNYYWDNPSDAAPTKHWYVGYGSVQIDISAYVGKRLVVSGACGSGSSTSYVRIDNASNSRLYVTDGNDGTIKLVDVTIPAGAKYLYVSNYFPWDADPFIYVYD